MTTTAEQKALKACRRYAELYDLIDAARNGIRDNMEKCPGLLGTLQRDWITGQGFPIPEDRTHLTDYFEEAKADFPNQTPEDAFESVATCEHCARAFNLVQDRRRYRRQLGAAKRFIARIGRQHDPSPAG